MRKKIRMTEIKQRWYRRSQGEKAGGIPGRGGLGVTSRLLNSDKAILSQSRGVRRSTGEKDPQGSRDLGVRVWST